MGRKKGKSKNRIPEDIKLVVEARSEGACERLLHPVCIGRASELHHRQMRSQGGEHSVVNLLHLCRACHREYVHMHPEDSYSHGWLVKSHGDPAEVPVTYRGQPVMLTEDGRTESYFKPRGDAGLSS